MDKQSISLDSIVSIKASQMPPNTYSPCGRSFPTRISRLLIQHLKRQCLRHLDRICRRHQTYQWLYPPVEYRLLQPLGNRRRHALQLRGCIPQLEYSFRYGPTTENGWWKRVVLQQGAERLLVADHDRYWNRCQQTERYVASQNNSRTQDRLFRPQCRRYENCR